jgi:hypothetical protein
MKKKQIYILSQKLKVNKSSVEGKFIEKNGETFYKISNYDKMPPFLISIVSATDHWMYISSKGGITAGRKNSDNALFAYTNDDVLHDVNEITGSKTIIRITADGKLYLWEPFSEYYSGIYSITRNMYKNISSTEIIFEEINHELKIKFQYSWTCSEKYGFIKTSKILNESNIKRDVEILDGVQNILPSGVSHKLQNEFSTLIDGYKKSELISKYGVGVFSLSSIPSDRAQPAESLKATTVWSSGIDVEKYLLSSKQISNFRKNISIEQEDSTNGARGSFLIISSFKIKAKSSINWLIAAEINQDSGNIIGLINNIKKKNAYELVLNDIEESKQMLTKIVAQSDGIQLTGNKLNTARHFSNVLFNVMRGGIFNDSYNVEKDDFVSFVKKANPFVFEAHKNFLKNLKDQLTISELKSTVSSIGDPHFTKLAFEYLPLTFSRRHGDPSRPWNLFSIDIKDSNNHKVLNYQGNWRDIFQNWEALALSYPKFLKSMIAKFLNCSTADGYNPYRIFRDGFDWEEQELHNPWANIGYWGDHQIIYLLKLLELSKEFNPDSLERLLDAELFTFANVPYRIKDYQEILKDTRNTIEFDYKLDKELKADEKLYGSDAKLLKKKDNSLVQVSLMEKLLLTLLVKMSNFIPGGGIWMNTQRPEWNDAKNALVGYGISMVTLFYIRRYVNFLKRLLSDTSMNKFNLSIEIAQFFNAIQNMILELTKISEGNISDRERKKIVDKLGVAGSEYRSKIYKQGFDGEKQEISADMIIEFCDLCLSVIDRTIHENERKDGLYHSYNILHISENELKVTHLYEMLEGQVAALSSGHLSPQESIKLLTALKKSKLYREDQNSYILYPNKKLPLFIEKNNIAEDLVKQSKLLLSMLSAGNREIIYSDINGGLHFQSGITNSEELRKKLESISDEHFKKYANEELSLVLNIYERTFCHNEFTGRANTFYKYEGLGSIYWHMVSKLLLAVQEVYFDAEKKSANENQLKKIKDFYYVIKSGIGVGKQPDEYGAFPTDPYSHTPSFAGVQQPGMTGQVKEDIITRFRELGIQIKSGKILIHPSLLKREEFLKKEELLTFCDLNLQEQNINCRKNSLVITYCQVPFIYSLSDTEKIVIQKKDGEEINLGSLEISEDFSQSIFNRNGSIDRVEVFISSELIS